MILPGLRFKKTNKTFSSSSNLKKNILPHSEDKHFHVNYLLIRTQNIVDFDLAVLEV